MQSDFLFFVADASLNVVYSLSNNIPMLNHGDLPEMHEAALANLAQGPFSYVISSALNFGIRMMPSEFMFVFAHPSGSHLSAEHVSNLLIRLQSLTEMADGPNYYADEPKQLKEMFSAIEEAITTAIGRPLQPTLAAHEASFFLPAGKQTRAKFTAALDTLDLGMAAVLYRGEYIVTTEAFMRLHTVERDLLQFVLPLEDGEDSVDSELYLPFSNPAVTSRTALVRCSANVVVLAVGCPPLDQFKEKVAAAFADLTEEDESLPATLDPFDACLVIDSAGRALVSHPEALERLMTDEEYAYPLYRPVQAASVMPDGRALLHVRRKGAMAVGVGIGERSVLVTRLLELIGEIAIPVV
ncbi:hypothetical protein J8273_3190 [Carpediemonas membranifera]|uniref:Uncharacterized protein n=1 Tax=Carpediemonas membranifera TaxID=201153 RepID=A0A8J6AS55_9EUKA|nr:hypothetical protein J8273_3190 [Carpediemonas membranifera]|eukprot:KAG9393061.1 hypothetical protein J8273_3190 [Carpediemonas membranifera]